MAETEQTEKSLTIPCPCCGQAVSITDFKTITDEEEEGFLMSMLGNVPFERTYSYMKDRIKITVKALTPELAFRHVNLSSVLVQKFNALTSGYGPAVMVTSLLEQLFMLKSIDLQVRETFTHKDISIPEDILSSIERYTTVNPEEDMKFLQSIVSKLSAEVTGGMNIPLPLISESVTRHKLLVEKLISNCYDEDFYQGVGQQS